MTIGAIIGTIIFGAVIGILARAVLPGRQSISAVVTVILGILGALIGYWVWGSVMGKGDTSGIDVIRWIISIIAAARPASTPHSAERRCIASASSHSVTPNQHRLITCPICWMRQAFDAP